MTAFEAACALREALEEAFNARQWGFERSYVSDGTVLYDFDESLVVEWTRSDALGFSGPFGQQVADITGGILPLQSTFVVHIARHGLWPDEAGTPPEPAEISENARRVHCDAALVLEVLLDGLRTGDLFGQCQTATFLGQRAFEDEGLVGTLTTFSVSH